jgi:hypothetical protein
MAMANKTEVSIGNKKVVDLTSALAFDAGFTVAYQDGSAARRRMRILHSSRCSRNPVWG